MTEEDARNAYNKAMLEKNHEGFINPFSEAGNRYKGRMF
jgi:hypothetical protein